MAKVYVGTYAKYNAGSLKGAWLDLSQFENYSKFVEACRELHKDERDPELMIQDTEGMPDGLSCGEWLDEADFNDIKEAMAEEKAEASAFTVVDYSEKAIAVVGDTKPLAGQLKALGGRFNPRLTCGAGWIFSKKKEAEVRSLLGGGVQESKSEKKAGGSAPMAEAHLEFPEGVYHIEKPRIENAFCFSDEGPEYEFYKSLSKGDNLAKYFLSENLSRLDGEIEMMEGREPVYIHPSEYVKGEALIGNWRYMCVNRYNDDDKARELTAEERRRVADALRSVRAAFEKRLQTYLKRYGTSKIRTWSYWANA